MDKFDVFEDCGHGTPCPGLSGSAKGLPTGSIELKLGQTD